MRDFRVYIDHRSIEAIYVRVVAPSRLFYTSLELFKTLVAEHAREYEPDSKCWRIERGGQAERGLREWLRYLELEAGAEIVYGGYRDERKEAKRKARAAMAPSDAYAALHLLPSAPRELVQAAYRTLAKLNHPDIGGDEEQMKLINSAYAQLEKVAG